MTEAAMRVLVLGSGVVGVASAWYLARAGHEVTVLDRQPAPGMETSFANAGQVSPGYSAPWAAPGIPIKAMKWLMMRHRPLVLWPRLDGGLYAWLAKMLANCTEAAYGANKARMVRLAEYSRDCLRDLRAETGIAYDERTKGTLQLFRTQKQLDAVGADIAVLQAFGVRHALLDAAGCVAAEPALGLVPDKYVGGLQLPGDETGDAFLFTQRLAGLAAAAGVTFRHGVTIKALTTEAGAVTGVETSQGRFTADRYVVAMGSYTPALLAPLDVQVPVYPVKGYSLTLPVTDAAAAAGDAGAFRLRPLPPRRRSGRGQLLDRAAPDDAGRHAGGRPDALRQSVPQHRPRHAGLDHGLRLGPIAGGSGHGPPAGDRA
jgi:D-amino-acid dehydrogenase